MKSFNLFPTLVKEYSVEGYPRQDELLNVINSHPTAPHKSVEGGVSNFTLNYNIPKFNFLYANNFTDLEKYFMDCVNNYSQEIGVPTTSISNCWFNIMGKNNYTKPHTHPGSSISGAYYPLLEEGTCDLIFHSPIFELQSSWYNSHSNTIFNNDQMQIPIKQNHLYLFPGWLRHSTEVNKGNKRIVISFNVSPWKN